jgi:hypothetical protein
MRKLVWDSDVFQSAGDSADTGCAPEVGRANVWSEDMAKGRHTFNFPGGEQLTTIGATFFISYLYYLHVDKTHRCWESIKTKNLRISTINGSSPHHRAWLERTVLMSEANLSKNTLGLDGATVKVMAQEILKRL